MQVLVLPGLDGTGRMLSYFAERLSERVPTAVVAYPGDRALSYPELADFVEAQLPKDAPFALVAESFSGPVATLLAARRPFGLAGLAYAASFVRRPLPIPRVMARVANVLPLKWRAAQALVRPLAFGRWADEAGGADLTEALSGVRQGILANRLKAILHADCRDELAALDLPLLYLRPNEDRLVRPSTVLEMARLNPALTVRAIAGPHFVLQTRADESAAVIGEFIAGLKSSPSLSRGGGPPA